MISSIGLGTIITPILNPIINPVEKSTQQNEHHQQLIEVDKVDISNQGRKLSELELERVRNPKSDEELTEEEKREVEKLKAADREVRAHERAHIRCSHAYR